MNAIKQKLKAHWHEMRQQRLGAWRPVYTAGCVLPLFFSLSAVCLGIGIAAFLASRAANELDPIDYTNCMSKGESPDLDSDKSCADEISSSATRYPSCTCLINFELNENFLGDVYFYYGLENFYQNSRRYVSSRNDKQLRGDLDQISGCDPFSKVTSGKKIAPCGAVANSMFNDTFKVYAGHNPNELSVVPLSYKGIIWSSDSRKFGNPKGGVDVFKNYAKPPHWEKPANELDVNDASNNGFRNVDFIIWMRISALPSFRKLYRKLDREKEVDPNDKHKYKDGLPAGNYTLEVTYKYGVTSFGGRKLFLISTMSWLGARNDFLGIAYLVVSGILFVFGVFLSAVHFKFAERRPEVADFDYDRGFGVPMSRRPQSAVNTVT